MQKKELKILVWLSITIIFILFPINYFLNDFNIDLFSNKILLGIIFIYLFAILYFYFWKVLRKEVKEETVGNLNNLRISLSNAHRLSIGLTIIFIFSSIFVTSAIMNAFLFHFELFDSPLPNNIVYFGITLSVIAGIWMFIYGLINYEKGKVYSSLESKIKR